MLIVGRDEAAALGVMSACALSLCSQAITSGVQSTAVRVLDGSLPGSNSSQTWRQLESVWTLSKDHSVTPDEQLRPIICTVPPKETARVLVELIAELHRRADEPGPPMFLFIFDLTRFRDLRKADDDFSYRSGFGGEEKPVNPGELFGELLKDGPGAGIFTFAWVESYPTAQRWLSRDQMNRFEQRVVFAMNANDSSSLIDSPIAGRLGENRAMLYRGDTGTLEKFRPFSPPPAEWLQQLTTVSRGTTAFVPDVTPPQAEAPAPSREPARPVTASDVSAAKPEVADNGISDDMPSIDDLTVL